ncbi:MAG TPA: T9SS type A sorting domain-containing protein, partial [Bacteroidia bacterium]|nr:T9SS type A sorting domain-containing protein [Bacteroidia bacterium]
GSFMGAMLYQGCPVSGGTCVGNAQSAAGNQSLCVNVTAGQVYYLVLDSWPAPTCNPYDLNITGCTGAPPTGTTVATPNVRCSAFTTTLSLNGVISCGYSFQWQSGPTAAGPWANIPGATANTATANVTSNTFYQCVVSCGVFTSTSTPVGTSITPSGMCGLCGVAPITLPYSITGTTTCGAGDDLTPSMVTSVCGNTLYLGGEDVIYTFTPTTSGQITITYSTSGSSAGVMLYQGCPNAGGSCAGSLIGISSFSGNQSMCVNVTAGLPYFLVIDSWPAPACNGYNVSISAPVVGGPTCALSTYAATSIPYNFDVFVGTLTPSTDDVLYNSVALLGFSFCYAGVQHSGGYIASNGSFVFDAVPCFPNIYFNQYAAPGLATGWQNTAAAPSQVNTTTLPQNAVNAPWQDIDPAVGGVIRYATLGVSPNRRFVVSFENVPMFSCFTSSPSIYYTGQIKLFETSNNIEIHVGNKGVCPGWNSGSAILGLTSFDGLTYIPPVNMVAHNYPTNWSMTNTAYRFTSPCASSVCIALPIGYKNFYGERIDRVNNLYWETAQEENLKYFSIERSADAENFIEISKVSANNMPSKYKFSDATTALGTLNYYRITSVENNGNRSSTNIIVLGSNDGELMVSGIFPNPVKDLFTVSIDSKAPKEVTLTIYDSYGKKVKSYKNSIANGVSQLHLDATDIQPGIYMIEIATQDKEVLTKQKFIKVE